MYKFVFGPVPSRRLGMSLGIDLVPKKVCSLDCVYCEVGRTTKLTIERKEYIPFEAIKKEIIEYFNSNSAEPDYITFSGSGEPTLNNRIGDVIKIIKEIKPDVPTAVLTNGTLLFARDVRESLKQADLVIPSLDAATEDTFKLINRPEKSLSIEQYMDGLVSFRNEYSGKIVLEVFILPDYNNRKSDIVELKKAIKKIEPDLVQLNTLDRPGTVRDLRKATRKELQEVIELLDMPDVEIIAAAPQRKYIKSYGKDAEGAIIETISRRPCTLDDLTKILGLHVNEINKYLDVLESEDIIERVHLDRGVFYKKKR